MTEIDHNASGSAYGWAFQVGAGIKLMLDHVKDFTCLKMEGKDDDIEIILTNGRIYAQAKSVCQVKDQRSATTELKKALGVIVDDYKKGKSTTEFIYITNIMNPFTTSPKELNKYEFGNVYGFSNLAEEDQKKIKEQVGEEFPVEKLKIQLLYFYGEGDSKFNKVKEKIKEFLQEAMHDSSLSQRLWNYWVTMFFLNCTDKPKDEMSFAKSKSEIIYPVVIMAIDPPISREQFEEICDYDDYEEICKTYRELIEERYQNYTLTTDIIAAFTNGKKAVASENRAKYKYEFVKEKWKDFKNYFSSIEDVEVQEAVTKLAILTFIERSGKVENIRKAAGIK